MPIALAPHQRIILPLDVTTLEAATGLIDSLAPYVGAFKVGYELGYSAGWQAAAELITRSGTKAFLDTKLNDIPRTVGAGVKALSEYKPWIINVHASAGNEALREAVANKGDSLIFAVTVLTSLSDESSEHIFGVRARDKVIQLALDSAKVGVDGIICSPQELSLLAEHPELDNLLRVVPGVRPSWAAADDQKRIMTPAEAVAAGADYLVIGRPILKPPPDVGSSVEAVKRIIKELEEISS